MGHFVSGPVVPEAVTATQLSLGQLWPVAYWSFLKQCLTLVVASGGTRWMTEDSELWVTNAPQHPAVKLIAALERKAPHL